MARRTITVVTPVGTFTRQTENDYAVISVVQMAHNDGPWAIWSYSLPNARKSVQRLQQAKVHGFYAVADGSLVAPGMTVSVERRGRKAAPKPVVVHEFEKCDDCDRRHGPERLRCGNCWRCHEPTVKCKTTKREIQESIERHAQHPLLWKVQTNTWRPFSEVAVPQCACHGKQG